MNECIYVGAAAYNTFSLFSVVGVAVVPRCSMVRTAMPKSSRHCCLYVGVSARLEATAVTSLTQSNAEYLWVTLCKRRANGIAMCVVSQ